MTTMMLVHNYPHFLTMKGATLFLSGQLIYSWGLIKPYSFKTNKLNHCLIYMDWGLIKLILFETLKFNLLLLKLWSLIYYFRNYKV